MPKLKLDGREVEFTPGEALIQVCDREGVEIPRFCYHDRLKIAGNCRMCLVEVRPGPPKPQASCALPAAENMEVFTASPMVKKAREGVMEFLLINHPLDCPICDQGGECDLQDQAMEYGSGISRFHEHKRAVEDKDMGPLVKTAMTRCIHCTRCVRFIDEVAGVPELGALGRGEHMEITTYLEKSLTSELSANVIDLCPVGALTSKPYAFKGRPWELTKTESIDVMDALGSNIRIDARGEAVMRILPRLHEEINEEWLSDKSRYAMDGLRVQRLDRPYIRKQGKLQPASWAEALTFVAEKMKHLKGAEMAAIVGQLCDVESMMALKDLMVARGSPNLIPAEDGLHVDTVQRSNYLFNTGIANLEKADVVLLIGTNPRHEAPLLNTRLRKAYLKNGTAIFNIGEKAELTYPVTELGNKPQLLDDIARGAHAVSDALKNAKNPVVIVGAMTLSRGDAAAIAAYTQAIGALCQRDGWNGYNILHYAAARVGALDIGFVPQPGGMQLAGVLEAIASKKIKFVYLLGADDMESSHLGDAFVVYQGHHGDRGAHRADVILPGAAYTEKDGLYVNTEGRVQEAFRAVFPPGEAKEDWKILRALSEHLAATLVYNTHEELRARIVEEFAQFSRIGERPALALVPAKLSGTIAAQTFDYPIRNFYQTDAISRASKTMAQCVNAQQPKKKAA